MSRKKKYGKFMSFTDLDEAKKVSLNYRERANEKDSAFVRKSSRGRYKYSVFTRLF